MGATEQIIRRSRQLEGRVGTVHRTPWRVASRPGLAKSGQLGWPTRSAPSCSPLCARGCKLAAAPGELSCRSWGPPEDERSPR